MIYLDNAATTFVKPDSVRRAVMHAMNSYSSPGRGGYKYAMDAAEMTFRCRERAAKLFGVDEPEKIIFTFNATHALNMAINSLVSPGDRVVISGYEHNSVVRPLYRLGAKLSIASAGVFDADGMVSAFSEHITENTKAVICNHVSNVFGFILPVERIADICRQRGVPFILDASQSAGAVKINAKALNADFIAMPGHKGLYGPQGTGLLICKDGGEPIMQGGTGSNSLSYDMPGFLPDRLEAGTHNIPGIAGLLAGMEFVSGRSEERILHHERALISLLGNELKRIPKIKSFYSEERDLQAGVLSFTAEGVPGELVGEKLNQMGIAVRTGLHCSPLAHSTGGTIETGTVRVSVSYFNTTNDIYALVRGLKRIVKQ